MNVPESASVSAPAPAAAAAVRHSRLWRLAGWLALAHVVLMFGSFALQRVAPLGADAATVSADHMQWPMAKGFAGGYLTCLSFLVFLLVATLFAQLLRGDTELSGWLSSTMVAAGAVYVAVTIAAELAPLGAALFDGHHGAPPTTITALVHLHWFAVYLATAVLGVFTVGLAGAARATGALPRWVSYTGFAVGLLCVVSVPGAGLGLADLATAVWAVWFLGVAVSALRRAKRAAAPVPGRAQTAV